MKKFFVIGIDEAGKGPLAGPLAVGAVAATVNLKSKIPASPARGLNFKQFSNLKFQNSKLLKNIRDSKKLSANQREKWFKIIKKNFESHVCMVGPAVIDKIGISRAAKLAVRRVLNKFDKKPNLVLLDGSLFAPKHYSQKTIIRGDEKIPLISAGSIIAKVTRDRKMMKLHKIYPMYCFDIHKGYGTKLHYKKLKKHSFSPLHRRSFCKPR